MHRLIRVALALSVCAGAWCVHADEGIAQEPRALRKTDRQIEPMTKNAERETVPVQPPTNQSTGSAERGAVRPEDVQAVGFVLGSFAVEGNTLLDQSKIDAVLDPFKGTERQIADVERARAELEKAYHAEGYPTVLVNLPEQTIEGGIVRLEVIEGRLSKVTVTGNEHYSWSNIRLKLPSVKPGAIIYEPAFLKELAAVNGNPDLNVAPVLKPGTVPGTVNLELKVKDRLPVHGKLEADNKGPITTPRYRLLAEVQHANIFGNDEILTVNTVQTPTDFGAVQNYGASFVKPVKWPDHILAVYASRSKSSSVLAGGAVSIGGGGDIAVAGNATVAGTRYIFPILKGGAYTHQLSVGVDYKRLEKTNATFPGGGSAVVSSGIEYTPASIGYTGLYPDRWWPNYLGQTKLSLSAKGYVAGIVPGGRKQDFGGDPNDKFGKPGVRKGSTGTFAVVQGGLDRVQTLPYDFTLLLSTNGQWASQPLIPAEQFFAGGMDSVRGYITFEAIGDHAVRGRAELTSPELLSVPIDMIWQRRRSSDYTFRFRLATFYDAAHIWVADAPPGQISRFRLEGAGGGIRVKFPKDVGQLAIDYGYPLRETLNTKQGDSFTYFTINLVF